MNISVCKYVQIYRLIWVNINRKETSKETSVKKNLPVKTMVDVGWRCRAWRCSGLARFSTETDSISSVLRRPSQSGSSSANCCSEVSLCCCGSVPSCALLPTLSKRRRRKTLLATMYELHAPALPSFYYYYYYLFIYLFIYSLNIHTSITILRHGRDSRAARHERALVACP